MSLKSAPKIADRQAGPAPPLGRREAGKAERRQRIIRAARELIRETGNAGLSMRVLAARAGVSLATPYNLFGSKRAIVLAVLQDVRDFHDRFSHLRATDPLERIFLAIDIQIEIYLADPAFYKTMWAAVFDTSDDLRATLWNPKRDAFWRGLIAAAVEAGALTADVNQEWLQRQLDHIFRSIMLDWVVGILAVDAVAPAARHGYALVLKGACAAEWRGPLHARILEGQQRLEQLQAKRPRPARMARQDPAGE
ncbi:MAG TPA: TetR/AcrR family transcriptional regulator [Caulobacteraceae bacterium]|nr:TetR/AcrR family transcriptional regulator [Caulobacteraceae bacterium]